MPHESIHDTLDDLTKETAQHIIETLQPGATPDLLAAVQQQLLSYLAQAHEEVWREGPGGASLQERMEKLLMEISAVGDGDLRVSAEVMPDTLGVVADSFNYLIEEMSRLVTYVRMTCMQATTGSQRMLEGLEKMLQDMERQSHLIEMMSRTVTERTLTTEAIGPEMDQLAELTRQTSAATREVVANVHALTELVEQLRASVATYRLPAWASAEA
jgi:methyl-accepting chemotaxis protein